MQHTRRTEGRAAAHAARVYTFCPKGDMAPMNACVHQVRDVVFIAVQAERVVDADVVLRGCGELQACVSQLHPVRSALVRGRRVHRSVPLPR